MKYLHIILGLFFSVNASAIDSWLCLEESSQREGNTIRSCGIGSGKDENAARLDALDNAKEEFNRICDSSSDCKNHEVRAIPQRTTCERDSGQYRCYRLIVYAIGDVKQVVAPAQTQVALHSTNPLTGRTIILNHYELPHIPAYYKTVQE